MAPDFDFEFGTWSVRHRRLLARLAGCTEWEQFDGTTVCSPILGGIGNVEQVWMPSIGNIGMALRLFDLTTREWSIYWTSSATGRLEPPVRGRFVDGVGTFEADDVFEGRPIRVRFVWDQIDVESARWSQSFKPAGRPEWETNWVMELTRLSHDGAAASTAQPGLARCNHPTPDPGCHPGTPEGPTVQPCQT